MKKLTQKIISFALAVTLTLCFSTSTFASNNEIAMKTVGEFNEVVIPVDSQTDMVVNLTIKESRNGEYVYADAHGSFYYTGSTRHISSYGLDVSFNVNGRTASVEHGGYITTYHNAYDDKYTGISKSRIEGEDTSSCTAKGIFTLINDGNHGDPASISLTLDIRPDGTKKMTCNGNFREWDVIW